MKNPLFRALLGVLTVMSCTSFWGFYAHQKINYLAVFTLPPEMISFYKKNIQYVAETAVNPDRRRFVVKEEAPRHYIDLDHFGDSALICMPRSWQEAVNQYSEDTLYAYGILPWHINRVYFQLKQAFQIGDADRILKLSSEIGHYIADANVPLHTTENYNGQLTGQQGIHAFWESRLPELFSSDYNFFVGRASYIDNPQTEIWKAIECSHLAVDSVLTIERSLANAMEERKFSFETKGKQTQRVYSREYSSAYHRQLAGMVERQMRSSIRMLGDFWFSAWVDAGQPDLGKILDYKPTAEQLKNRREELQKWRQSQVESDECLHN
ncbi:MAG TPA: zinc dependent phospholipase C family protein [Cyclobacteriaceae bacterium]|nr:zinc dependent phospholipase C family protein [Cyclobacteriaceae bacterium]